MPRDRDIVTGQIENDDARKLIRELFERREMWMIVIGAENGFETRLIATVLFYNLRKAGAPPMMLFFGEGQSSRAIVCVNKNDITKAHVIDTMRGVFPSMMLPNLDDSERDIFMCSTDNPQTLGMEFLAWLEGQSHPKPQPIEAPNLQDMERQLLRMKPASNKVN